MEDAEQKDSPVVFSSDEGSLLFRSSEGRRRVFDLLKDAGVFNEAGGFIGAPSEGVARQFRNLATKEVVWGELSARFRKQIFAYLSARAPLPPGFASERLNKISGKQARRLAARISEDFASAYFSASLDPEKSEDACLESARGAARGKIGEAFSDPQFRKPIGKELRESFKDIFPEEHSPELLAFQREAVDLMQEAAEAAVEDASVFDVSVDPVGDEYVRLNVLEVGSLRRVRTFYYPLPAEDQVEKQLDWAQRDLVREIKRVEEADLKFDLSYYGIDESEAAKYWLAKFWKGELFRTALHVVAPPLEKLFYRKFKKPDWVKELQKSTEATYLRKKIDDLAWRVVRNYILTIPLFIDKQGRCYSLFSWKHDPRTGRKEKTYFTPFSFVAGWWKKRRHVWAAGIEKAAKEHKGSTLLQNAAKILSPHLRRKKKDGRDDRSNTVWWLVKGAAKSFWVVVRPLARAASRTLGLPRLQAALVRKWYAVESSGGFSGNLLRFIRHGKYWGQAFVGGIKGGLGYGLAGYLITGSPYGAAAFGGAGWAGTMIRILAKNPQFMALAGQPGVSGAVAGFLKAFQLPVYSAVTGEATAEVFSLLHFPVIGPTVGSVVGYAVGSYFGYPHIGAAVGTVGGFLTEYGVVVLSRVTSNVIFPKLVAAQPWLKYFSFLRHWKAGLVGAGIGYLGGKYLGLPEWACIALAAGGFLVFSGAASLIGRALSAVGSAILSRLGISGLLARAIAGPIGLHIGAFAFGFWKGAQLGVRMGLPFWGVMLSGVAGGLVMVGVSIGAVWGIKALVMEYVTLGLVSKAAAELGALISGFISGLFSSVWAGLGTLVASSVGLAIGLVAFFVLIILVIVLSAMPAHWETISAYHPGASRSQYLKITKTAEPSSGVSPGEEVTFTITYENIGSELVTGVILHDSTDAEWKGVRGGSDCFWERYIYKNYNGDGFRMVEGPEPGDVELHDLSHGSHPVCGNLYEVTLEMHWQNLPDLAPGESETLKYVVETASSEPEIKTFCDRVLLKARVAAQNDEVWTSTCVNAGTGDMPSGWPTRTGCLTQGPHTTGSHSGLEAIDVSIPLPEPSGARNIYATHNGIAEIYHDGRGPYGVLGNYVILRSLSGEYRSYYGHLSSIAVGGGQRVNAGELLGVMGSSGNSSGLHLHYEFRGSYRGRRLVMNAPFIPRYVPPCMKRANCNYCY